MERASALSDQERRLDLDWVRIGAFGLLILYHVGMFYVPWNFHVKSPRVQDWLVAPMVVTNPWRLALLFLVSGAATRFMTAKLTPGALARARTWRLLPPLVFGMLVVVPPQAYMQVTAAGYRLGFPEFYGLYLRGYQGFCAGPGHCLVLPTWNHLWFIPYLLSYTLLLSLWLKLAPRGVGRVQAALEGVLKDRGVLVWPTVFLVGVKLLLSPRFPETHTLVGDWAAHALYASTFLFGFMVARSERVWADIVRFRWVSLAIGIGCYGAYAAHELAYLHAEPGPTLKRAMRVVYGVDQWSWIATVLGFARVHLAERDGPVRRYLTDAIFPFYIIHQTTIVVLAPGLARVGLPLPIEAAILIGATALSCVLTYEIARRVGFLRPLLGLKSRSNSTTRARGVASPRLAEDCC